MIVRAMAPQSDCFLGGLFKVNRIVGDLKNHGSLPVDTGVQRKKILLSEASRLTLSTSSSDLKLGC